MRRASFLLMLLGLLGACGAGGAAAQPTPPPPAPTAMPSAAPSALPPTLAPATALPRATLAPTAMPTTEPTTVPTAIPSQPVARALYACAEGLCSYTLGEPEPKVLLRTNEAAQYGYAFTADGAGIVFAREAYPTGALELLLADRDLQNTRTLATVSGSDSGAGGLEGYGVVGVTADNARVLYEDAAQLSVARMDGSDARAVMEPRPYGASSTHSYAPSPSGLRVLVTASGSPNRFEIANVDARSVKLFELPADRRALALIDDAHVLAERFDPPFDPGAGNPAGISRFSLGYEIVPVEGDALGAPVSLREDDGSAARSARSVVAGDWLLLSDDETRDGEAHNAAGPAPLWLLNVRTGARQPVSLPLYDGYSRVALSLAP